MLRSVRSMLLSSLDLLSSHVNPLPTGHDIRRRYLFVIYEHQCPCFLLEPPPGTNHMMGWKRNKVRLIIILLYFLCDHFSLFLIFFLNNFLDLWKYDIYDNELLFFIFFGSIKFNQFVFLLIHFFVSSVTIYQTNFTARAKPDLKYDQTKGRKGIVAIMGLW